MRVAMVRNAIFWPVGATSNGPLRTASAQWNGRPVTCLLFSGMQDLAATPGRMWEETEYCLDNATGILQVYSRAPGTYVVYDYSSNIQYHGRQVPGAIAIYVGGKQVLDGKVSITDANPADKSLIATEAGMVETPVNNMNLRFPLYAGAGPRKGAAVKAVIVNVTIDTQGRVAESEVSAASDPSLASAALGAVTAANFGPFCAWRQAYINVKVPSGN